MTLARLLNPVPADGEDKGDCYNPPLPCIFQFPDLPGLAQKECM